MQLNLPPSTESLLRQHAIAAGKDLESFAIQFLQQQLESHEPSNPAEQNHDDWVAAITAWSNSHPRTTRLVDDSRESIYEGRGL